MTFKLILLFNLTQKGEDHIAIACEQFFSYNKLLSALLERVSTLAEVSNHACNC